MTTVTLAEAIAAIDTAMKTHDPSILADLEILTSDGQSIPVARITWDQIQAELDAHRVGLEVQLLTMERAERLLPELDAYFGDLAPAALQMLQELVYEDWPEGTDLPTIPHPSGIGEALEPAYVAAAWDELDDHDRRALRGRLDLDRRVGKDWPHVAAGYLRGAARAVAIDLAELDEDGRLVVALMTWDAASPESRDRVEQMWREAVRIGEQGQ